MIILAKSSCTIFIIERNFIPALVEISSIVCIYFRFNEKNALYFVSFLVLNYKVHLSSDTSSFQYLFIIILWKYTFSTKKIFWFRIYNFLITNLILQITLIILPIWIATLLSQLTNLLLGFHLYGGLYLKKIMDYKIIFKYLIIASLSWMINIIFINIFITYIGISNSISAIFTIPILTIFFLQLKNILYLEIKIYKIK